MWMGFAFIIHDTFISGSRSNSQGVGKDKFDSNYSGEELIDDIFLHYKMSWTHHSSGSKMQVV